MNNAQQGRILVIRGGAIGDFILTLPVFAALRKTFPQTAIDLLGYPHIASLATLTGTVDAVHPIDARSLSGFFARNGALDPALSHYFAQCQVIFSYLFDPDEIFRDNLARVTRAQVIQGPHKPTDGAGVHASSQLLTPLQRLAIFDADPTPHIPLPPAAPHSDLLPLPTNPRRRIAIHPGSGSERKNWPLSHWIRWTQRVCQETQWDIELVGGEADLPQLAALESIIPQSRLSVARSLPLPQLALRLAQCSGFVGHDSGISHLAAALGQQGFILWGPTDESVWRPLSNHLQLLRNPSPLQNPWSFLSGDDLFDRCLQRWGRD